MNGIGLLEEIKRIKTIADIGLLYHTNEYDKERYIELEQISLRLLNNITGHAIEDLQLSFPIVNNYPTAKHDYRIEEFSLIVRKGFGDTISMVQVGGNIISNPKLDMIKQLESGDEMVFHGIYVACSSGRRFKLPDFTIVIND